MQKGIADLAPGPPIKSLAADMNMSGQQGKEAEEEAMLVGGEPQATEPVVLSPDDSQRLWKAVLTEEPVVLTARMQEAIANYKRTMSEGVD